MSGPADEIPRYFDPIKALLFGMLLAISAFLLWGLPYATDTASGDSIPPPPSSTTPVTTTVAVAPPPVPSTLPPLEPVVVAQPADRGTQVQVTPTVPPPEPVGLWGMPFAPEHLDGCEEMEWYRSQAGLIERFDRVGFLESSCRNDVSSFCCHGYWQLYVTLHLRDHQLGPRYAECEITSIDDVLGPEPIKKQRNACGALAVYEIAGGGAWDVWGRT